MSIEINIPVILQHFTNKIEAVQVNGSTVGECLDDLVEQFPDLRTMFFAESGEFLNFLSVYVNGEYSYPKELSKPVKDGDELSIAAPSGCC